VYDRAQRFLPWNAQRYAPNVDIEHHWIKYTDCFWYSRKTKVGVEFLIVDARTGIRQPAFNHELVAAGLSAALGKRIDAGNLPLAALEFAEGQSSIRFTLNGTAWECNVLNGRCAALVADPLVGVVSPDGKWLAFLKGQNIWLRSLIDNTDRPLTDDGEEHYGYGIFPGTEAGAGFYAEYQTIPAVLWSPDSKRLLTHRLDERKVLDLDLLEMAPAGKVRPVLHSYRYAFPGDPHKPTAQLVMLSVTANGIDVRHEPFVVTAIGPIEDDRVWWSADSSTAYVIPREEGQKRAQLFAINAESGETRLIIEERCNTYIEIGGSAFRRDTRSLADGRIIWYSERDDWGHLYLYDGEGKLLRQLTSGPWKVLYIDHVDELNDLIYFVAGGREPEQDPYMAHLYRVGLDGSGLTHLTPESAHHGIHVADSNLRCLVVPEARTAMEASFSPTGNYFVETFSRPDLASTSVLRAATGQFIAMLEQADVAHMNSDGVTLPEPFCVDAADGYTKLFGNIYRPSNFDESKRYPVIDVIYPGPQRIETPKSFRGALFSLPQALAELGFVVVNVDGRGTPFRSKSFHDVSYGDMRQAGNLEDHMAAIRQLSARYPYMDLARVGITGSSGGGSASTRAILEYPDFFKVAVSICGNHDERGYLLLWAPTYQGPLCNDSYDSLNNSLLAGNLKGKLLLMHGEMDYNVHPALTMQLVDALIKANREFEMLLVPGEDHQPRYARMERHNYHVYMLRKTWDFFIRHLQGAEPPENYVIRGPVDYEL